MLSTMAVRATGGAIALAAFALALTLSLNDPPGAQPAFASAVFGGLALGALALLWIAKAPRALQGVALILVLGDALAQAAGRGAIANDMVGCIVVALMSLIALHSSASGDEPDAIIEDRGTPSLRTLAVLTPAAIALQIALGVGYRHEIVPAIPHATWAFGAILIILMTGTFVLTAALGPAHRTLRAISVVMMSLVFVQLVLGVLAFIGRLSPGAIVSPALAATLRMLHMATGALLLSSSLLMGERILRHARRAGAVDTAHFAGNGPRA